MKIRDLINEITVLDVDLDRDIIVTETKVMFINDKATATGTVKAKLSDCKDGACKVEYEHDN